MQHMHPNRNVRRGTFPTIGRFIGATSALVIAALAANNLQAKEPLQKVSFRVPGAAATYVTDINPEGDVTGFYADSDHAIHGFSLTADGDLAIYNAAQSGGGANFHAMPEPIRKPLIVRKDEIARKGEAVRKPEALPEPESIVSKAEALAWSFRTWVTHLLGDAWPSELGQ